MTRPTVRRGNAWMSRFCLVVLALVMLAIEVEERVNPHVAVIVGSNFAQRLYDPQDTERPAVKKNNRPQDMSSIFPRKMQR